MDVWDWNLVDIYIPTVGENGQTEGDGRRNDEDRIKDWQHYQNLPEQPTLWYSIMYVYIVNF